MTTLIRVFSLALWICAQVTKIAVSIHEQFFSRVWRMCVQLCVCSCVCVCVCAQICFQTAPGNLGNGNLGNGNLQDADKRLRVHVWMCLESRTSSSAAQNSVAALLKHLDYKQFKLQLLILSLCFRGLMKAERGHQYIFWYHKVWLDL